MPAAIELDALTRRYGARLALDHVSLRVDEGEVLGFLGPNGAGKSTTIRILLDLIRPSAGRAAIAGMDCQARSREVRAITGYLPGDLRLYGGLTGRQTIEFFASLRDESVDLDHGLSLARDLDLDLDRHARAYSKGNRQKLGIVCALLARPRVLLLDEPTSGLDPLVQHAFWQLLRREAARGATVFFSSHVMSEVEQVCDRVAILREGRLVAVDPLEALRGRAVRHVAVTFEGDPPAAALDVPGVRELARNGVTVEYEVAGSFDPFLRALAPFTVHDLRTEQATLDDVLLSFYSESRP